MAPPSRSQSAKHLLQRIRLLKEERQFARYLRYQTTHQRAFHKCLSELLKLRAEGGKGDWMRPRFSASRRLKQKLALNRRSANTKHEAAAKAGQTCKRETHDASLHSANATGTQVERLGTTPLAINEVFSPETEPEAAWSHLSRLTK
jgi:hypothetical protein